MTIRPLVPALVLALAALIAGPLAPAAHAAHLPGAQLVSVLAVRSKLAAADRASFDPGFFSDRIRGELLDSGADVRVMTRENLLSLLAAQGKTLQECEGECEVETGRKLGADFVVSGELLRIGATYKLSLRLHDTAGGTLLAAATASGATAEALDQGLGAAVKKLTASLPRAAGAVGNVQPLPPSSGGLVAGALAAEAVQMAPLVVRVRVDSPPVGTWVLKGPSGQLLCELPCAADLRRGAPHRAELKGDASERIDLPDTSTLQPGTPVDAAYRAARGNRTLGIVGTVAGAGLMVGGVVGVVGSASSSSAGVSGGTGGTAAPSVSGILVPFGVLVLGAALGAGSLLYALYSQPEHFDYSR